jgi:hypothetical protein
MDYSVLRNSIEVTDGFSQDDECEKLDGRKQKGSGALLPTAGNAVGSRMEHHHFTSIAPNLPLLLLIQSQEV